MNVKSYVNLKMFVLPPKNKSRRGSSADWSRDRLRAKEIAEYKQRAGQVKQASGVFEVKH